MKNDNRLKAIIERPLIKFILGLTWLIRKFSRLIRKRGK